MGRIFRPKRGDQIEVVLEDGADLMLGDVLALLDTVEDDPDDPGWRRLDPPVYLGDEEATAEWRRLMGDQLDEGRHLDRDTMQRMLNSGPVTTLSHDEATQVLRVINEARLVLAARLGIDVASDYESVGVHESIALHVLGMLVEDLTEALSSSLD